MSVYILADALGTSQLVLTAVAVVGAGTALWKGRADKETEDRSDWREGMKGLVSGAQTDASQARDAAKAAQVEATKCHEECAALRVENTLLLSKFGILEVENARLKAENSVLNERVARLEIKNG